MAGRPAVLLLGYYHCPSLCGLVRDDSFDALRADRPGRARQADYVVIDISIDPAERPDGRRHGPGLDDLARYPVPGADRGWHFLTGTAPAIAAVADAVGFRRPVGRSSWASSSCTRPAWTVLTPAAARSPPTRWASATDPADLRAAVLRARNGVVSPRGQPASC